METNKDAYIRYDPTKENAWVQAIFDALGTKSNDYYKVATQQLVTILIIVIAKKEHQPYITEVETNYVGVGLMNMIGNKGGVGVRLRFYDSYMCFIGSHLAAFTDQVDRRNQDFAEICKRLTFTHKQDPLLSYVDHSWNDGGDEGVSFLENQGIKYDWSQTASVFHSDFLIWLGDLNYRINLTEPEIKSRLERKQVAKLMDYDQLSIERKAGRAFPMFDEGDIDFLPTYKFDAGTNQYDTSAKRRAPSWTDRVLWKKERVPMSSDTKKERVPSLKLQRYDNCMEMMSSDHKPVYAHMELQIRQIDSKKQKDTKAALARQLAETKDNITKGQISSSFVEFGDVHFMEHKERTLILENTGQVLAPFRFIPKMDENEPCPSWLHVHPMSGILGPGEKVVLHFEILIDPTISTPFNEGTEKIDSILVLRLENGKDFFIVVSGAYHPTCFGVYLDQLALMTLPVSEAAVAPSDKKSRKQQQTTEPSPQQATLPKELWRLLNFLWNKNMLCLESLFLQSGDRVVSNYIRRCLDTGEQFDTHVLLSGRASEDDTKEDDDTTGANSMIDVLVAFLECLPEPVIPTNMYKQALKAAESAEALSEFKDKLPYIHLNVLLYITSFLKDAIKYAPTSCRQDRIAQIVQLFTVLLRPSIDYKEQNPLRAQQQRERFIHQILNN
ncbi:DNase I-like protein [Lichtheimia hyalospora FSU 10163]|nr:DNase I-like protein [Lichtheimia hyalospora FSU 10163]